jgi:hypothetical protein
VARGLGALGGTTSLLPERIALALLTQRNIEEAAKATGIAPNTLLKWMKEPEFNTRLPGSAASRLQPIYRATSSRELLV